jgi:hypothetical protein
MEIVNAREGVTHVTLLGITASYWYRILSFIWATS